MVAWNVIFTQKKDPLLNCVSYTNTFIFTSLDAVLCSLKLMGFCHWLHWEQEQALHGLYLSLWKVMAVERKEQDKTHIRLRNQPVLSGGLIVTAVTLLILFFFSPNSQHLREGISAFGCDTTQTRKERFVCVSTCLTFSVDLITPKCQFPSRTKLHTPHLISPVNKWFSDAGSYPKSIPFFILIETSTCACETIFDTHGWDAIKEGGGRS